MDGNDICTLESLQLRRAENKTIVSTFTLSMEIEVPFSEKYASKRIIIDAVCHISIDEVNKTMFHMNLFMWLVPGHSAGRVLKPTYRTINPKSDTDH